MTITEDRTKREAEDLLAAHRVQVARAYLERLERVPPRPFGKGHVLIEYGVAGAAVFYMADGNVILDPPGGSLAIEERTGDGHLDADTRKRWERLVEDVRSHLAAVTRFWAEIAERLTPASRRAGLIASDRTTEGQVDYYWPALFVEAIWREAGSRDAKGTSPWEAAKVVEDITVVPMRHTLDTVTTWIVAGTNMVRSQSRESVGVMMDAWEEEARRAEPIERGLSEERARIEAEAETFRGVLGKAVPGGGGPGTTVGGACPTCQPWLDELGRAPSPPS